ncbi:MAG: 1-(5-phosphoribosyl)-5-[(5-phosphoribosylamino)methylideneamino]imidazole-4-carboxamide isomerase [Anaerolineae bacterium]
MIIYPAIDIRDGRVVRLFQGDPAQQTVHADDPAATAARWVEAGASWLHVVNLDGALGEANPITELLGEIAALGVPVQFGGGLRSAEHVEHALNAGAARVVIGTLAVRQPEAVAELIAAHGPDAIAVALDARDGRIATEGWQNTSEATPVELGGYFAQAGLVHALYTDISRDGALTGVNVQATVDIAEQTGLRVIASGGVASLQDIHALRQAGVAGVVIGKSLYTGAFTLQQALAAAGETA